MILKSLVHIFDADGNTAHSRKERLLERDTGRDVSFAYQYLGVMRALRDRLFMIDGEILANICFIRVISHKSSETEFDGSWVIILRYTIRATRPANLAMTTCFRWTVLQSAERIRI